MILRFSLLKYGAESQVGIYQAVHGMVLYITIALGQATNLYLDPILKRDIKLSEKIDVANQYLRSISLILGSVMVIMVLFPEFMLRLLYSYDFVIGAKFLFALMVIESIHLIGAVYMGLLVGEGWYKSHFLLGFILYTMIALICHFQVPNFGIWGVVMALGIGAVFTISFIYIRLHYACGAFVGLRQVLLSGFIFLTVTAAGYWVSTLDISASWVPSHFNGRVGILLGYWLILFLMLTSDEKVKIKSAIEKGFNRICGKK